MLERLTDLPPGVDGLRAVGRVSREDYEEIFAPLMDEVRREGRHIRFLYELGPEFDGFTAGAAWEDAKLGLRFMRLFDGCAIVTDVGWLREATRLAGFFMPCPVRVYGNQERAEAIEWLRSLPEGPAVLHRLIPKAGVIVVEVSEPLRVQDFEDLAQSADRWIESQGDLQGIVIHARQFPGWENFESFLRHVRFVRDHHEKVQRIALAVDSKLADLAPRLAEHFVQAEVQGFTYDELDAAIAWAAGDEGREAEAPTMGQPSTEMRP